MKTLNLVEKQLKESGYTDEDIELSIKLLLVLLNKLSFADIVSIVVESRYKDVKD